MLRTIVNPRFKVGQVWAYQTRPYEIGSTLTIVRTEADNRLGNIIHIQDVRMKNPHHKLGLSSVVSHLPCSEEAISGSVIGVVREGAALPDFEEGYQEWRAAFDAGQAGVWGVPVAKMIDAMESVLNQPQGASNMETA